MSVYAPLSGDFILPFNMVSRYLRGRIISLGSVADEIVTRRDYPDAVSGLLGEALALAAGLASTLKFEGTFSVRTRSDGPISMLLADVTNAGDMRAYARFDEAALAAVLAAAPGEEASLPRLLGAGHVAFSVERADGKAPYQGIVDLAGPTLADCAHAYFQNSEQLDCAIMLSAARRPRNDGGGDGWRAGCLLLERLPPEDTDDAALERRDEDWRRAVILLGTCTVEELLDPALPREQLLHRLFHEEGLRVMEPRGLAARCRCSRDRIEGVLGSFDPAELEDMKVDGALTVTCEFCGQDYAFNDMDLAAAAAAPSQGSD
jgi:molecular chaperone Hsp33